MLDQDNKVGRSELEFVHIFHLARNLAASAVLLARDPFGARLLAHWSQNTRVKREESKVLENHSRLFVFISGACKSQASGRCNGPPPRLPAPGCVHSALISAALISPRREREAKSQLGDATNYHRRLILLSGAAMARRDTHPPLACLCHFLIRHRGEFAATIPLSRSRRFPQLGLEAS